MSSNAFFSLRGRTVMVTGASGGIGLHLARLSAAAGAEVVLAARRLNVIEREAAALRESGMEQRAIAVAMDVTSADSIEEAFARAASQLGQPVDVLVNNAGVLVAEKFMRHKEADIDRVLQTNLKGAFLVAQRAARAMQDLGRGVIINVVSTSGVRAGAFMASYGASKAGLIHLTRIMALELAGKGIRVNALCPGNFETDMQQSLESFAEAMIQRTPLKRFGRLEDLDGPFLLLASDAGRYMTGSVLTVDGGQSLSWM